MAITWTAALASVRGQGHIRADLPCQDASGFWAWEDGGFLALVCDGAGSASHADQGAQRLVAALAEDLLAYRATSAPPQSADWPVFIRQRLYALRLKLREEAQAQGLSLRDWACTLILAWVEGGQTCYFAHIGDGRAALRDAEGWQALMQPFKGEEANETVFFSSDFWEDEALTERYLQTKVYEGELQALCLLSDGCERAAFEVNVLDPETGKYKDPNRPFAPFLDPNLEALRQLHAEGKTAAEIQSLWADFLHEGLPIFTRESDDKTLVLVLKN